MKGNAPPAEPPAKSTKRPGSAAEPEKVTKAAASRTASTKATAPAKPAPKPTKAPPREATRAKPEARRAVARPLTRVVKPAEPREERREREEAERREAPRPRVAPRPLPTAPAGHAPVIAADGNAAGTIELPAALVTVAKRRGVLFQALVAALANARQATSATKNRSRVAGGGAKPWRQKGTGRARQGSTRAPQWRHGGVVFGPNGRRYKQRLPAKMRRAALAEALAAHVAGGRVLVLEEVRFDGDRPRTREVAEWLARIGETGRAVLVTAEVDDRVGRAAANLQDLELRTPGTLRLADVLRAETVLVHRPALEALAARAAVGGAQ